jgi:hypothetical protein
MIMEDRTAHSAELTQVTTDAIRDWLLDYAWSGNEDQQRRNVECIMSQGDVVSIVDGLTERYAGQAFDHEQAMEAQGFALSSLYECHDGPHLPTCPDYRGPFEPTGKE